MSRYHIEPDGFGNPAIWTDGDHCVASIEGDRINVDPAYAHQVWRVVTGVLAPDEATVERVAWALTAWNNPPDPYFVIRGRTLDQTYDGDPYELIVGAVLAALADPAETGGAT